MKYYESYKETNVSWLKEIPRHWKLERVGKLFSERKRKVSDKEYPPLSVTKNGILPQLITAAKSEDGDNRKMVQKGDFVINSRSDRKGSSGISAYNGSVSLINIVLKPRQENNSDYMQFLLKSNYFIEEYYRNGRGIVADLWTTRYSEMKTIMLPVPPRIEQDKIVRFLNWKLSKINKLLDIKKRQADLLKEKKQATINRLVTKGLDDSVVMKDSNIEWLRDIPEDWEISKLKRFCKVNTNISHLTKKYSNLDELVFLPMENVSVNGEVDCSIKRPYGELKSGYSSFAKNDVVVAKITPCFENGKGACLDKLETEIGYGTTEFITLRCYINMIPKYLYYITKLSWFRFFGAELMTGSAGQKRISSDFISNFRLGVPNIDTQKSIVEYLDNYIDTVDKAISKVHSELTLLVEYRNSLISSAVTGKIDVRDIVILDNGNRNKEENVECNDKTTYSNIKILDGNEKC